MSIAPNFLASDQQLLYKSGSFFKEQWIGSLLKKSNFVKKYGWICLALFKFFFLLVFSKKKLYQDLQKKDSLNLLGKDAVYRFLNRPPCRRGSTSI
ncbi:MAG: hypothetical protein BSOLF_1699 [Candidatus Carbobacillus altaicus]|uniref:Uncharacterized protein n=1 Tax=Candidatus Carbonibacillus altaicus TaxID=2163959 RepID=A0A2R6Y403_9BACL|nr:MAG: hypothetical protein BSOLF_1699 [Candidatus Carbobacillus altaicus]